VREGTLPATPAQSSLIKISMYTYEYSFIYDLFKGTFNRLDYTALNKTVCNMM